MNKSINHFFEALKVYSRVRKILFLFELSIECFTFNISFHREIFWNIFRDCSVCFDWAKVLVIKVDTHQNSCPLFIFVNEAGSSGNSIFSLHKQISLLISESHFEWQNLARIKTRQWSTVFTIPKYSIDIRWFTQTFRGHIEFWWNLAYSHI